MVKKNLFKRSTVEAYSFDIVPMSRTCKDACGQSPVSADIKARYIKMY